MLAIAPKALTTWDSRGGRAPWQAGGAQLSRWSAALDAADPPCTCPRIPRSGESLQTGLLLPKMRQ
eukprot:3244159-Alexandrium_andersonii.AAC.1